MSLLELDLSVTTGNTTMLEQQLLMKAVPLELMTKLDSNYGKSNKRLEYVPYSIRTHFDLLIYL